MAIVEHPLRFLILALFLLLATFLFFKIVDFLREREGKNKKESKSAVKKEENPSDIKKEEPVKQVERSTTPEHINTTSNGYNYLHDRFVENPTSDDVVINSNHSSVFLTDDEYDKIRNEKI